MTASLDADARALLTAAAPAFVPGWAPGDVGPGAAVIAAAARLAHVVSERLDAVPAKARLAFLDLVGTDLLGAQAARTPVVFVPVDGNPDARVAAGTRLGAPAADGLPLVFETEEAMALPAARLVQVMTVRPEDDTYADSSGLVSGAAPGPLFGPATPIPHQLYLGSEALRLDGGSVVEVEVTLAAPAAAPLPLVWEFSTADGWQAFSPFGEADASVDGTQGLTRSGTVRLVSACAASAPTIVAGRTGRFIRARVDGPLPPGPAVRPPLLQGVRVRTVVDRSAASLPFDTAYAVRTAASPGTAFQPFGGRPQPGDVFAIASDEAFSRPGTVVTVSLSLVPDPAADTGLQPLPAPVVVWEYWNGSAWAPLPVSGPVAGLQQPGTFTAAVPDDALPTSVNGTASSWWRARLARGTFGGVRLLPYTVPGSTTGATTSVPVVVVQPPYLDSVALSYVYRSPWRVPDVCLAYDDLQWTDSSTRLRTPGTAVAVFPPTADTTAAVYLGFDKAPPVDRTTLLLDVGGVTEEPGAPLVWEYWNGHAWAGVGVADETAGLTSTGLLAFVGAPDSVALPRFGAPLHWLRGRLLEPGDPPAPAVNGIYLAAEWAAQYETVTDETLGTGTGEPAQAFFLRRTPVLGGSGIDIEVRELAGGAADVELALLVRDVVAAGGSPGDVRTATGTGGTEAWVRWSGNEPPPGAAGTRTFRLDPALGRVVFGGAGLGRAVPAGALVVARAYRSGGGARGNVPAGAVTQLLGAVPYVSAVRSPLPAAGGADVETVQAVADRGPRALRHGHRAVTVQDLADLARDASPAVAAAWARADTGPGGFPAPGWTTVVVLPWGTEPAPQPSAALLAEVSDALSARLPVASAGRVRVTGPAYVPVGVSATLAPVSPDSAGATVAAARAALTAYLHPLTGGPGGAGWGFGRALHASDVAGVLQGLPGVAAILDLSLLLDGVPAGDAVDAPGDGVLCAGPLRLRVMADAALAGRGA